MSDIVERAAYYEAWARDIRALNGTSVDADYSDETARVLRECAAEIERLRAEASEIEDTAVRISRMCQAAEAQRDALVVAAEGMIASLDDYAARTNDGVFWAEYDGGMFVKRRALADAIAAAKEADGGAE